MTGSHPPHGTPDIFGEYDIKIQQEEKMLFNSFGEPFKLAVTPESPVTIQIAPRAGSTISTDPELLAAIIIRHAWGDNE